jgi:hypothetical protein
MVHRSRPVLLVLLVLSLGIAGVASGAPSWQQDEALALAVPACPSQSDTVKVCVGTQLCYCFSYSWPSDGKCPAGCNLVKVGSVTQACTAATDIGNPAPCNDGCKDAGIGTSKSQDSSCCSVTKTRNCSS